MTDVCLKIRDGRLNPKTKLLMREVGLILQSNNHPYTLRQIHYNMVARGFIQNNNSGYKTIGHVLKRGRYLGLIPWNRIVDDTRQAYKTPSYDNIDDAVNGFVDKFRLKGRWDTTESMIEVWVEKRTLKSLCYPVANKYDIYLNIGGGWNSISAIWEAVNRIIDYNTKKLDIIYFGDLDPSGDDMPRDIEDRLREFYGVVARNKNGNTSHFPEEVNVHKVLLNDDDVEKYNLVKRFDVPVKKGDVIRNKIETDSRAKSFYDKYGELFQVEMEALSPEVIMNTLEEEIKKHINQENFDITETEEKKEIQRIKKLIRENRTQEFKKEGF